MYKNAYILTAGSPRNLLLISAVSFIAGCTPAPSIVMFGASFPDWLLCSAAGILITCLLHVLLSNNRAKLLLKPVAIVYPCITAISSMLVWLLLFPN
ncbi:hypothetical protein KDD30_20355 (plasmid) [Photobacterium sp. GJ3]|uniref:YtcA family lipoprotein n=1 Tax=Photobacterium sp. GJ3 TaxID=2829502 RepID=UPI001B8AE1A6|nr:YtcA family lipoprotein [Photobacterium sp. GJ3]QUJ70447.1 hypothetical protein KDD30_20355 [Photobacterium sp. GJ3]